MFVHVVAVAKSYYRLSMVIPILRLRSLLGSYPTQTTKVIANWMGMVGMVGSDFSESQNNDLAYGVLIHAEAISVYLDASRRGFDVSAVRYEDLVARPLDMCRVILEFCHLPVSLAELAVKAMCRDSQRNSRISKSSIGHVKDPVLTPEKKANLNELLKKYGLPLIGEPNVVEGTLSCS